MKRCQKSSPPFSTINKMNISIDFIYYSYLIIYTKWKYSTKTIQPDLWNTFEPLLKSLNWSRLAVASARTLADFSGEIIEWFNFVILFFDFILRTGLNFWAVAQKWNESSLPDRICTNACRFQRLNFLISIVFLIGFFHRILIILRKNWASNIWGRQKIEP
jgi:hypothetical protein